MKLYEFRIEFMPISYAFKPEMSTNCQNAWITRHLNKKNKTEKFSSSKVQGSVLHIHYVEPKLLWYDQ